MGAILQINRDFPFQVALSFDEAAMDVLDWLEGQTLEWDMYVDPRPIRSATASAPWRTRCRSSGGLGMRRRGGRLSGGVEGGCPYATPCALKQFGAGLRGFQARHLGRRIRSAIARLPPQAANSPSAERCFGRPGVCPIPRDRFGTTRFGENFVQPHANIIRIGPIGRGRSGGIEQLGVRLVSE